MTNLEYCNEILSIIGNVTEANDAIYHLAYDAYLKLGGQETQPSLATIYNELKGAIQIWDNTNDLTITENGTYSLLGKVINVSVGGQPGPTPVGNRLRFESLANNSTISLSNKSASYDVLQYSLDGINWNDLTTSTPTITLNTGDLMYIKGNTNADSSSDNDYYNKFSITGRVAVKGDLVDLCGKDLNNNPHNFKYQFYNLFNNCVGLVDASNLELLNNSETAEYLYYGMFWGCTSLVSAPELPATSLASYCYARMFWGCSSLTEAPELPATSLADFCYLQMFQECTSLTEAPELPATSLAYLCYSNMFYRCSSLVSAPELPATTLTESCYAGMFGRCFSLTEAPELPATSLADGCYNLMFLECTSLTEAPELPATTLAYFCYLGMFAGCSSLNKITIYANDISASNCLHNWVQYVAGSGTFYNMGIATYLVDSTSGIPIGWTENRVKPANDELWYTSTNGNIVEPSSSVLGWPLIISNTYVNGKGIIKFASNITSIAANAFYSKGTLKSIIMSDNITSIVDAAFFGCSLTTMVIPENITTIGRNVALYNTTGAFEQSSLTSVVINNKMGMIGTKTFKDCTRLTNITFNGTKSQWNSITKGRNWYENVPASVVHCSDGDVTL